ncbi:MAG: class I SAM-dependent methyltransferase [Chloroflexota bacterium]
MDERLPTVYRCILCGNDGWKLIVEGRDRICPIEGTFRVLMCTGCGLYRTDPQLTGAQLARHYGAKYPIYDRELARRLARRSRNLRPFRGCVRRGLDALARVRYWSLSSPPLVRGFTTLFLRPIRLVVGEVLPFSDRPGNLLDVGCGAGSFLVFAFRRGWTCYGVEPSRETTEHLVDNGIADVRWCRLEEAAFDHEFFDLINASHVLEHTSDPVQALRKMNNLLKPAGLLFLKIPRVTLEARILGTYWMGWDLPRHLYHFGGSTFKKALVAAGFEILSIEGEVTPNNAIWVLKSYLADKPFTRGLAGRVDVGRRMWRVIMWPIALCLWLTGQSGRIKVVARKASEATREGRG